ncbi:SCO1664 family protein [Streptomyces silvensis]|uniref:Phosphatidylinositol kinase n=1 Tax=Streptomyces silvensis TaxID=1765722 RepID=A0A0W7WTS7_9ACTN|nr:SCO1664 family protein [Streptomyces silvensis]KUF13986.1 phosphatidylinositol kinase [Streptomyces silvensis]
MPAPERIPAGSVTPVELLTRGELTVRGQIREASNAVLYCTVAYEEQTTACVYKPVAGERPLWDFPDGTLARREVAAYEVSEALGWGLVPPTVLRDGPYGEGMVQLWIEAGDGADAAAPGAGDGAGGADGDGGAGAELLALVEGDEPGDGWKAIGYAQVEEGRTALLVHADDARLRRLAVLDAVINNADRKGGHLLPGHDGRLFGIDHGVTFNVADKLRTLLWGWAGEKLPDETVTALGALREALAAGAPLARRLGELLTPAEVDAVRGRVAALLASGRHPAPSGEWPAIPWPPV